MIYHAATLQILYVSVVYQLNREWCPPSLGMTIFVVTLLVRMMLLCQCGVPAGQGVVPSELGYDYFCGNTIGENDAWVSSY
jgi:hypothetical protein